MGTYRFRLGRYSQLAKRVIRELSTATTTAEA